MSNSDNYAKLAGVVVDVSAGSLERATNLLVGISGEAYRAVDGKFCIHEKETESNEWINAL